MLTLSKVAVTGGLSCGKSSVCRFFKECGAQVVSADELVHQLLSPNTSLGQQIIALLGQDIVANDKLDHGIIAKKVFNDPALLQSLEKLLHPAVLDEIERRYQQAKDQSSASLFIAEIPLLFEIAAEKKFTFTIAVWADEKLCRQRFKKATGYGDEEYDKRMSRQLSANEKARRADFVIRNCGTEDELRKDVFHLYNKLISSAKQQ